MREVTHHCGLFAVADHPQAAQLTYFGLYAQQHRGQEAAGICSSNGEQILRRAGLGLVTQAFNDQSLQELTNPFAIGHVRYSTTGSCSESNIQPFLLSGALGEVAICHNGNLVNAMTIRREYESMGTLFFTSSDTEVILHMLADKEFATQVDPLASVMRRRRGS
ncbi:MAG: amidophosphoribosyltransferase, partial [Phycisphaerae bacterium]